MPGDGTDNILQCERPSTNDGTDDTVKNDILSPTNVSVSAPPTEQFGCFSNLYQRQYRDSVILDNQMKLRKTSYLLNGIEPRLQLGDFPLLIVL